MQSHKLLYGLFLLAFSTPLHAGYNEGVDAYQQKDYATAMAEWKPVAEKGDPDAQYNVGAMYSHGEGVKQDYEQAVAWYRKAAAQGYAKAQFNLGVMYEDGHGVNKDPAQASTWYRKAAEHGHVGAQYNLGNMYYQGQGIAKDFAQAAAWWRKSADQGDAESQYNLGVMYSHGEGVTASRVAAYALYSVSLATDPNKAGSNRDILVKRMNANEIAAGENLARGMAEKGNLLKALDAYLNNPAAKEKH